MFDFDEPLVRQRFLIDSRAFDIHRIVAVIEEFVVSSVHVSQGKFTFGIFGIILSDIDAGKRHWLFALGV